MRAPTKQEAYALNYSAQDALTSAQEIVVAHIIAHGRLPLESSHGVSDPFVFNGVHYRVRVSIAFEPAITEPA